jgi:transketolase
LPEEPFYIPQAVIDFFKEKLQRDEDLEKRWKGMFDDWARLNPALLAEFELMRNQTLPADLESKLRSLTIAAPVAGRKASSDVLQMLGELLPFLYGGSADLSVSDLTMMKKYPLIAPGSFGGRNIKFGVREFGMATMATGLAQTRMILPFIGTFLTGLSVYA